METVIAHEIEPEITADPPRRTRLPWRTQMLLLLAGALTLLLVLSGARAALEAGRLAWVAVCGRHTTAQIMGVVTSGPKSGVWYRYTDPLSGQVRERFLPTAPSRQQSVGLPSGNNSSAGLEPARSLQVGQRLSLRIVGGSKHPVTYFWSPAPWGRGIFLLLCGLIVMTVGARLLMSLVRWRRTRVRLLTAGQAVVGTVIHKRSEFGDTSQYYVRYGYATVGDAEPCEHEEQVHFEQWKRFEIGQPVTVLYDPSAPMRAGLYALMKHG